MGKPNNSLNVKLGEEQKMNAQEEREIKNTTTLNKLLSPIKAGRRTKNERPRGKRDKKHNNTQ
jgi:hypothetical protein